VTFDGVLTVGGLSPNIRRCDRDFDAMRVAQRAVESLRGAA
jgi:hypothetical protein